MEINTKMHLLELSTMIHVVRNRIKYILVNARPRDISLAPIRDLICRVYQSVNGRTINNRIRLCLEKKSDFLMLYLYQRKIRRQTTHLRDQKLCELFEICCYSMLSSPIGRVPLITQTFKRIRLFQNESKIF